jgi:hypothetical protein
VISAEAKRTLVKSPPELWAELSDPESLARHLSELGEIRIVSSEPETKVEWEGEGIGGVVELKASGWGTKVTLTAVRQPPARAPQQGKPLAPPEPESEPEPVVEPEPAELVAKSIAEPESEPEPERRPGFFARLFRRRRLAQASLPVPEVAIEPQSEPTPELELEPQKEQPDIAEELKALEAQALEESTATEMAAVLTAVLDRLGAAHHRPFSRA